MVGGVHRTPFEDSQCTSLSSGANVIAAIRVAERLGPGRTVVTLMCDSGLKYLSTDVYGGKGALLRVR